MKAGIIIGGTILLIIGVIIYGLINNTQTQCQSLLGNIGRSLDPDIQQRCTDVNIVNILAILLGIIGIILVIVGAVSGREKQDKKYKAIDPSKKAP